MKKIEFKTVDGETISIDPATVTAMAPGINEASTRLTTEDDDVVVLGSELEVAAKLQINPLDYIKEGDDDESIEELIEEGEAILEKPVPTEEVVENAEQEVASEETPATGDAEKNIEESSSNGEGAPVSDPTDNTSSDHGSADGVETDATTDNAEASASPKKTTSRKASK